MNSGQRPKTILYVWEWGTGAGHLQRFLPIARSLACEGHQLFFIVKDPSRVPHSDRHHLQFLTRCYTLPRCPRDRQVLPRNDASIAWNLGYHDAHALRAAVQLWRNLLTEIKPDIVIQDFGLTAGLVAGAMCIQTIRIGTGYTCPPRSPLPLDFPVFANANQGTDCCDSIGPFYPTMLGSIRAACHASGLRPPQQWDEVVNGSSSDVLATLPLLDPYASLRRQPSWAGVWDSTSMPREDADTDQLNSTRTSVSHGDGPPTALAYLKPFRHWTKFFDVLKRLAIRVELVTDGVDPSLLKKCDPNWVTVSSAFCSIKAAARSGRAIINNGNHGTTALSLLYGMPVIACPLFFEQRLTARAIQNAGVGASINLNVPDSFAEVLQKSFSNDDLTRNANQFASRYGPAYLNRHLSVTQTIQRAISR